MTGQSLIDNIGLSGQNNNVASTKYCKMNKKDKLSRNLIDHELNHIFLQQNNRHSTRNLIHNSVQCDDTDMIFFRSFKSYVDCLKGFIEAQCPGEAGAALAIAAYHESWLSENIKTLLGVQCPPLGYYSGKSSLIQGESRSTPGKSG